jgi:Cytochrome c554 and c-prime
LKTASRTYANSSGRSRRVHRPFAVTFVVAALIALTAATGYCKHCCPQPDLTIFFTSDTRGYLRRCGCTEGQMGGLSARAGYIKRHGPPGSTLVLDAGDTFFPGLEVEPQKREFYLLKAQTMARAMDAAGTSASDVGEFDLAYGPGFLQDAVSVASFPFLCANASWDGGKIKKPFDASTVVELGGYKIGIVGVLGSGFPYGDFSSNFGDIEVSNPLAAAQAEIDRLRPKVDLVVVLTHLSVDPIEGLVSKLRGADVVIQGHSSEQLEAPKRIGDTLLLKGYMMGKYMGRLDLWLEDDPVRIANGEDRLVGFEFKVVPLDESVEPDERVESIIAAYRQKLKERRFVFTRPEPKDAEGFIGPDACRKCHPEEYGNWSRTAHFGAFGILTIKGDQYDPECLPCHTTGFGYATGYPKGSADGLDNVTCESCHGRGAGHAAIKGGKPTAGLKDEIKRVVPEDTCMGCHDEEQSPYFDYQKYLEKGGAHRGTGGGSG